MIRHSGETPFYLCTVSNKKGSFCLPGRFAHPRVGAYSKKVPRPQGRGAECDDDEERRERERQSERVVVTPVTTPRVPYLHRRTAHSVPPSETAPRHTVHATDPTHSD